MEHAKQQEMERKKKGTVTPQVEAAFAIKRMIAKLCKYSASKKQLQMYFPLLSHLVLFPHNGWIIDVSIKNLMVNG